MSSPKEAIRLMLIDDHPAVRDGVRMRLEANDRFMVVAEADCTGDAIELAGRIVVDVALLDISMRGAVASSRTMCLPQ